VSYFLLLIASLLGFWLLLSGFWDNSLLLALGLASALFTAVLGARIERLNPRRYSLSMIFRLPPYWVYLFKEIVLANVDVVKRIWRPDLFPISPITERLPMSQQTSVGRTIYANSITLTPGTVSMEVTQSDVLIHALTREAAAQLAQGDMDRRVTKAEGILRRCSR
jgi:multicomponent Na+:H+ antiporter subunit E